MPISAASRASNAAEQLQQEIDTTEALVAMLKQEQEHLINADIEHLTALAEEKSKVVSQLSELAMARHRRLAEAGLPANEEGMQRWMKRLAPNAPALAAWSRLLELMSSAKELNRTNGILINSHLARNQTALNVLQRSAQGGEFYGPNGQASVKPAGRGLVVG
jgi:flagellar biosynthesis protein FlgN